MNKEQPVTLTLQELDNTIFAHLTAQMQKQFPNDHRNALKVAMHVADGAMAEFEALAKRQSKSGAAKAAAEARWGAGTTQAAPSVPVAEAGSTPEGQANAASWPAVPKKRNRRTKAQIAADNAAQIAAMTAMPPLPGTVPPAPFTPAELQGASEFGSAPPTMQTTPEVAAAIAAASGSPVNTPSALDVPAPPPPLQIPTFA